MCWMNGDSEGKQKELIEDERKDGKEQALKDFFKALVYTARDCIFSSFLNQCSTLIFRIIINN